MTAPPDFPQAVGSCLFETIHLLGMATGAAGACSGRSCSSNGSCCPCRCYTWALIFIATARTSRPSGRGGVGGQVPQVLAMVLSAHLWDETLCAFCFPCWNASSRRAWNTVAPVPVGV